MDLQQSQNGNGIWSRLRELASSGSGLTLESFAPAAVLSALRMLFNLYPARFRKDPALRERTLRAFVVTIIPGASIDEPNLVRMYSDTDYPFHPYTGYIVFDLNRRSRTLFRNELFDTLARAQREVVIEDALAGDATTARLYRGAMLMAQVSFFAGIYDPDRGCPLINFPGTNNGYPLSATTYPDAERYLGQATTPDGNPL